MDYVEYLGSKEWHDKRIDKFREVGYYCEHCGSPGLLSDLSVHHLHYDSLGDEDLEDLEVLCAGCHEKADWLRKETRKAEIEMKGLTTYANKKYGEDWLDHYDFDDMCEEFEEWKEIRNNGKIY